MRTRTSFEQDFPKLKNTVFNLTSVADSKYNCIAWAVSETDMNYWPIPVTGFYWPRRLPKEETVSAFTEFFAQYRYVPCANGRLENGYEKLALFCRDGIPAHAIRQLSDGTWTTKMGSDEDLTLNDPRALEGVSGNLIL